MQSSLAVAELLPFGYDRLQTPILPAIPSHTTWEDSPCLRLRASFANSGLRHSSIKSLILHYGDGIHGGRK
jgi:hypothetical protein